VTSRRDFPMLETVAWVWRLPADAARTSGVHTHVAVKAGNKISAVNFLTFNRKSIF